MWRFLFFILIVYIYVLIYLLIFNLFIYRYTSLSLSLQHAPLIWRFRFIVLYIINTPPHSATPAHDISQKHPVFGDSGSSCMFETPPSFGDSGSLVLHTSSMWPLPVYHISCTRPLIWRFRFFMYLKLNTPPHLAIPVHLIS